MPAAKSRPLRRGLMGAVTAFAALLAFAAPGEAQPTIRDAEIETTLRGYVDPIFVAAGLDPTQIEVVLIQDNSINAFVTSSRTMYIHTGLIAAVQTPNELKGVMAHETGHIAGHHVARSGEQASRAAVPALISVGIGILAIAAGAPAAGAALIAGSPQFAQAEMVQFTRAQESQADQAAVTFMDAAGQSGNGLLDFANRQFRYNEMRSAQHIPPWMQTHPLWTDRIQALRQRVGEGEHRDAVDTPAEIEHLKLIQAKLYGYIETAGRTYLKYPDTDQSPAARYARSIAAMRASDFGRADKEAESLTREFPDNPYYHELVGEILLTSGRVRESVPHERRALALLPGNALLQINLGRALVAMKTPAATDEAITCLSSATHLEPDNTSAWYELAEAYDSRGDEGMARLASAELSYSIGDYAKARIFAARAKERLDQGTTSYLRALDIMTISETRVREGQRG